MRNGKQKMARVEKQDPGQFLVYYGTTFTRSGGRAAADMQAAVAASLKTCKEEYDKREAAKAEMEKRLAVQMEEPKSFPVRGVPSAAPRRAPLTAVPAMTG